MGALGALDAAIQLGRARGQDEEADAACLAGLLEDDLELGAAVHLDGADGEGHGGSQAVEEARPRQSGQRPAEGGDIEPRCLSRPSAGRYPRPRGCDERS